MGLDALLAKLESRRTDPPDTPCNMAGVSANPAPIVACTLDTPDTPDNINGDLEARIRAMAARWGYSGDDLALALAGARQDPEGWRRVVESDERRQ